VSAAGYDDVDSSFYAFEQAGYLLRRLLPKALSENALTKAEVQSAVEECAARDVESGRGADS